MAGSGITAMLPSTAEDYTTPDQIGPEIRDLRKAKRMTIKELSLASSLSAGHLSQIERGLATPSIKALHDIAKALGVTIGWFLHGSDRGDPAEREYIVRANSRRTLKFGTGITDELLSPNLRGQLELLLSRFPPNSAGEEAAYTHQGEEAGVLLAGTLELWIGEKSFTLNEGDSFCFPSTVPHRYRNPGEIETVVIWVITPPSY